MSKKRCIQFIVVVLAFTSIAFSTFAAELPKRVRFASLSVGMSGHLVATGVATVMSKYSPIKVAVDPVGMHTAVLELIERKEAQMGAIGTLGFGALLGGCGFLERKTAMCSCRNDDNTYVYIGAYYSEKRHKESPGSSREKSIGRCPALPFSGRI